ncbi:MAG: shikimate kinase [Bacteroidota bacterium]
MLVFLVGFMGAGKTTAGKLVSSKTGFSYIDLDAEVELKAGKSIAGIFKDDGQDEFRHLEAATLRELCDTNKTVVAVGGGCPCINDNMEWMLNNGIVIFLKAHHGTLFHRLMPGKKNRPLIATLSDVQLMEYILNQLPIREKFYSAAQYTIETATEPPSVLCHRIVEIINKVPAKIS